MLIASCTSMWSDRDPVTSYLIEHGTLGKGVLVQKKVSGRSYAVSRESGGR